MSNSKFIFRILIINRGRIACASTRKINEKAGQSFLDNRERDYGRKKRQQAIALHYEYLYERVCSLNPTRKRRNTRRYDLLFFNTIKITEPTLSSSLISIRLCARLILSAA